MITNKVEVLLDKVLIVTISKVQDARFLALGARQLDISTSQG